MPTPQASSLDVLYSLISIREEIDNMGDPHNTTLLPIEVFDHRPIRIVFITPLPNSMLCGVASSILNALWELFYHWGIAELKTVQVSTLEGIRFSEFSLEIQTDSINPRDLPPSTNTSQPSPSQQSNLTFWPPVPFIYYNLPYMTLRINAISITAGMPSAGAMVDAIERLKDYLDGLFSSPHTLLPHKFISEVAVSVTTGISVMFSSEQENWYTWSLARSVLSMVASMEHTYGSVQLDEVVVSVEGESDRTFRLEKFDKHPDPGNIILPRTLLPSSIPSLSLSANRTLTSASLQEWPATPLDVAIVQDRVSLTIIKLIPVQDYPTLKADIEALFDHLAAGGGLEDELPSGVTLRQGRVTVLFYSTNLKRGIALQVLLSVANLEGFFGAAEVKRAALVIDGRQGGFSLGISRVGAGGLNEYAEPTFSRRSLPSNNKKSVMFSPFSPSQNLTVHDLPANLLAWPPLPLFLQIDNNLFINITAISPAAPPYSIIPYSIVQITRALVDSREPAAAPLPLILTTLEFGRVQANWTSVTPYRLTFGIALEIIDTVLELEENYGIKQIDHMDITVGGQICGRFSLVISDPPPPS